MRRTLGVLVLMAATACTPVNQGREARPDRDVLTLAQIEDADQTNALDLIRSLRPQWLRTRGMNSSISPVEQPGGQVTAASNQDPIQVYVDGNRMGSTEVLSTIPAINIGEIRFYSGPEAQSRFGLGNSNGAIAISTRRGGG